jgi:UDP-N-acetylglucosamine 4,6-dehydratase
VWWHAREEGELASVERVPARVESTPALPPTLLRRLSRRLDALPARFFDRGYQLFFDGILSLIALWIAFALRFDGDIPVGHMAILWAWTLLIPVLRPALLYAFGGYDRIWRYFSLRDAAVLAVAALPATLFMLLGRLTLAHVFWPAAVPIGIIAIDYGLFVASAIALRSFRRLTFEVARSDSTRRRTLVVGTPDTLSEALRRITVYSDLDVVGLLAPETYMHGLRIGGFAVMGEPSALPRLLASQAVDVVLIADAGIACMGDIVSTATEFGVDVRLLPAARSILQGDVRVSAPPRPESAFAQHAATVMPPHPAVRAAFENRVVLVTGAGGSIGAELSRQAANLPIARLLLLDQDENSIFEIHRELTGEAFCDLVPLVADIRDRDHLARIFERYQPRIVLHAAAYKHVPVMEHNGSEAVLNNVVGTRIVAEMAQRFHAERLLVISTDKAVHPTSIMGATKRVAEMLIQSAAPAANGTRMACVRFGNVVGSRGSVVPIFLKQIADGRPLTVTDEEMTRFFMTIPEAVQLVLEAATLGSNGDVYMLDMGDPVKIMTLARKLIEMSGLRPDIDIPIRIVGSRPGEKLHERLWPDDAEVAKTDFPRVMSVKATPPGADFAAALTALEAAALAGDDALVRHLLRALPIGYQAERAASASN